MKLKKRMMAMGLTMAMAAGMSTGAVPAAAGNESQLKVGIYGGLDSLNPWTSGRITKDMVTYVLYETLASCQNGSTEIESIMMENYEQTDDRTYNVTIYDYIKDAAGNPVTAADVVFSFEQYNQYWATTMESIKATGDYTFELKLNTTAAGAFQYLVCKVPIATEKAYNDSPDQFATTACGTMPYTVAGDTDYVSGTSITLRKTGEYWQTNEDLVYAGSAANADIIEFDILPEATQLALAVKQNEIDVAMYIDASMLDDVSAYEGVDLITMPSSEDRGIMFCMTDDSVFADDLALRQAVLYAIDNETVANICGYGYGKASEMTCGSEELTVGFNESWKSSPYAYDPEKAKELLAESNYNGETLRLLCNSNARITDMWLTIQANLMAVGINAELNVVEGTTYGSYRDGTSGQYELAYAGPGNGGYVTADLWNTLFNRNNYDSGATWAGLKDDELQALYDAIAAPDGYTQENLDAFYNYITDNALYYEVYVLPEYAAVNSEKITGYFSDWNRFIRANTFEIAE
ncbi:MAG: ABC transporter substrate-binding protein [Eubacteriales bacterium]|nr:ABC transporter substrate-binding protein [Eubacteriales bacterium]